MEARTATHHAAPHDHAEQELGPPGRWDVVPNESVVGIRPLPPSGLIVGNVHLGVQVVLRPGG